MSAGIYLDIFIESASVASILPFTNHASYYAALAFGGFNVPMAFTLAVLGAVAGQMFNWGLGRIALRLKEKGKIKLDNGMYTQAQTLFKKYGIFLLLFCWVMLGNLLVVAAAFLNVRLRVALPLIIAGTAAYYAYPLFS